MATDSFADFQGLLSAGDDDAWVKPYQRFFAALIRLASAKLDQQVRGLTDPEDVVNSAYKSLVRRQREGEVEVRSWGEMFRYLVKAVGGKCLNINRYHRRQCRDVRQQTDIDAATGADRDLTPTDQAILAESIERIVAKLTELEKTVFRYWMEGHSVDEIARLANCSTRTVFRVTERIADYIRQEYEIAD